MQYENLTKKELVKIIEGIRSARYGPPGDPTDVMRILEALLLEQYELKAQIQALKDSSVRVGESLHEYLSLFENAPVAYVVLDSAMCILKMNEFALTTIRRQQTALTGFPFSGFLAQSSRAVFLNHFTECGRSNKRAKSVNLHILTGEVALPITMLGCMVTNYRGIFFPGP